MTDFYKFQPEHEDPSLDLDQESMEKLKNDKYLLYEELADFSGKDFLGSDINTLKNYITKADRETKEGVREFFGLILELISQQSDRIKRDDIADKEQRTYASHLEEEKNRIIELNESIGLSFMDR